MFLWRTTATATKRRSTQTITMIEEIILQSLLLRSASFLFSKESNPGVQRSSSQKSRSLGVLSSSYKENKDVKQCMKKCTKILVVRHTVNMCLKHICSLQQTQEEHFLCTKKKCTILFCQQMPIDYTRFLFFCYFLSSSLCTYKGKC